MKLYRVVAEREGEQTKEGGRRSTELVREDYMYAAEDMAQVWEETAWIRDDPERTLWAIVEEAPAVTVLGNNQND